MNIEKRKHTRYCPEGLTANITINPPPPSKKIILDGIIVNMSYTGIKIKLNTPIDTDLPDSEIIINLTLPESGVPVAINGIIKHFDNNSELGMQYTEDNPDCSVDKLIFECIKKTRDSVKT